MGHIGDNPREYEFEPLEVPGREPLPYPEPAPVEPEREPVPA